MWRAGRHLVKVCVILRVNNYTTLHLSIQTITCSGLCVWPQSYFGSTQASRILCEVKGKTAMSWCPQNVSLLLHPNIQVNRQYVVQPHLKTLDILLKTLNMVSTLGQSSCMHALYLHITSTTAIIVMIIFSPCVSKGPAL